MQKEKGLRCTDRPSTWWARRASARPRALCILMWAGGAPWFPEAAVASWSSGDVNRPHEISSAGHQHLRFKRWFMDSPPSSQPWCNCPEEGYTDKWSRWWEKLCRIQACINRDGFGDLERLFHICLLALVPDLKPGQDVLVGKQVTNHMYINWFAENKFIFLTSKYWLWLHLNQYLLHGSVDHDNHLKAVSFTFCFYLYFLLFSWEKVVSSSELYGHNRASKSSWKP